MQVAGEFINLVVGPLQPGKSCHNVAVVLELINVRDRYNPTTWAATDLLVMPRHHHCFSVGKY